MSSVADRARERILDIVLRSAACRSGRHPHCPVLFDRICLCDCHRRAPTGGTDA